MRHLVALLLAISMSTSGCATYQAARQARNAGIVVGVLGVGALAGGIALVKQDDAPPCPNDGNGCAISGAAVGGALLILTAVNLIAGGLALGLVGASGMENHSPEAERSERELEEQARIGQERVAREEREAAERDRERERDRRDKAHRRDQAFALLKSAVDAARTDRCDTALELQKQILELDPYVHDAWFVRDPDIKRCLAPSTPPPTQP